jgi:transposase-like protein
MAFSPQVCTNPSCSFHQGLGGHFVKKGFFRIKRLNQTVRRFQCKHCLVTFSSRSFKPDFKHKKMDLNSSLRKLLVEGCSIRSASRILSMTYKNTYNKFLWLTKQARVVKANLKFNAEILQFDELETIHHTKCKPVSIAIMVNENYQILSLEAAQMPAKGKLANFSVKKYGYRCDEREQVLNKSFVNLTNKLIQHPRLIQSDAKPSYKKFVQVFFPSSVYEVYNRSEKERHRDRLHERIHKKVFDPLFALNQRCAFLRSSMRRLTRRSWCTTKKIENLQGHLDLFLISQFV